MPWGVAVGAAVAIAGQSQQEDAEDAAHAARQRQGQVSDAQLELSREQWEEYKNNVFPILRDLGTKRTTTDRTAEEVALAAGDVKESYAASRGALERRADLDPNMSADRKAALLAPSYMDESAKLAGAMTTARRAERARVEDTNWGRGLQLAGAYQGLPQQANANLQGSSAAAYRGGALALDSGRMQAANAAQLAYGGGYLGAAAKKWMDGGGSRGTVYDNAGGVISDPYGDMNGGYGDAGFYDASDTSSLYLKDGGAVRGYRRGGVIRRRYAEGGVIRGPGTGTSDSVPGRVKEGSFILSADTTKALGMAKVMKMFEAAGVRPGQGGHDNNGVPVRLSNGEVQVPPEVVQHHGEEFFHKLQQKYHKPKAHEDGFAEGGVVKRRALPKMVEDAIFQSMPGRALGRVRG